MKKYLLFIMSFAVLFFVFQLSLDMLLTLFYTPEITSIGTGMYSEVEFGNASLGYLVGTLFVATIVFFFHKNLLSPKMHLFERVQLMETLFSIKRGD
ncbi:hypothetical protein [Psychrobacillus sp. NPDC096389]|uniref:hypothetical protein n=1 Tax=Psychrobacillus sp. NPDC096389 TaxID=3364490 RepID=UPI00380DB9CA